MKTRRQFIKGMAGILVATQAPGLIRQGLAMPIKPVDSRLSYSKRAVESGEPHDGWSCNELKEAGMFDHLREFIGYRDGFPMHMQVRDGELLIQKQDDGGWKAVEEYDNHQDRGFATDQQHDHFSVVDDHEVIAWPAVESHGQEHTIDLLNHNIEALKAQIAMEREKYIWRAALDTVEELKPNRPAYFDYYPE